MLPYTVASGAALALGVGQAEGLGGVVTLSGAYLGTAVRPGIYAWAGSYIANDHLL
jgi:hypothetical protein